MKETALFHMPDDPQEFLAALAAVESLTVGGTRFNTIIDCLPEYKWILPKTMYLFNHWTVNDLEVRFDSSAAYSLVEANRGSLAGGFSVTLGTRLVSHFPSMIRESELLDFEPTILVMRSEKIAQVYNELLEKLLVIWSFFGSIITVDHENTLTEERRDLIKKSCVVIGLRSVETYIAASMRRFVVEIAEGPMLPNYFAKWENQYFTMLYGDEGSLATVTASQVFEGLRAKAQKHDLVGKVEACTQGKVVLTDSM